MTAVSDVELALPEQIRALPRRGDAVPAYVLSTPECEVLFVAASAGTGLPPHVHGTDNATVVVSGSTVVTTARGEHRYGPGDWYQTNANEEHAVRFEVDCFQVELRFRVSPSEA